MGLPKDIRSLDVDLPACPRALVELLALLQDENAPTETMARVIESDMGLAAAIVRTVNSAMFGLLRRVQTVGEAVRYLGSSTVAAITFGTALRAAFPPTPAIERVWQHASCAGFLMSRSAAAIDVDPFEAHTAGLFGQCGQAVLLARAMASYEGLLASHRANLPLLLQAETAEFGVNHAALGSALCAAWGLAPGVVKYVRAQGWTEAACRELEAPARRLLGLGAVVDGLLLGVSVDDAAARASSWSGCTETDLIAAVHAPWLRLRGNMDS